MIVIEIIFGAVGWLLVVWLMVDTARSLFGGDRILHQGNEGNEEE